MRDEALYLKEIYKFKNGEDYFGLDVQNALFFRMNKIAMQVIDVFPNLDGLALHCDQSLLNETIDAFKRNGFITPLPPSPGHISRDKITISNMGLCLYNRGKDKLMPIGIIRKAIDLLIHETVEKENCQLVFITDNFDNSLETVIEAIEYAEIQGRKFNKNISFALRTKQFPLSSNCVRMAADRDIAVEIVFDGNWVRNEVEINISEPMDELAVQYLQSIFEPMVNNILITLNPDLKTISTLEVILDNLFNIGFRLVLLDTICPGCRGNVTCQEFNPDLTAAAIKEYSLFSTNNGQRRNVGLINIVPLIDTVMSSSKNLYGCRAGIDYMAVSPNGEIYPCHNWVENDLLKIGSIYDGLKEGMREKFILRNVENKEKCKSCGIRYFCGGGPVVEQSMEGSLECNLYRELAEYAMITYNGLSLKKKTRIMSMDKWMNKIMPYRKEISRNFQRDNIIRRLKVSGSSMHPFLKEGDEVTVHPVDVEKVKIGDIICFGKPATCHRVIRKLKENGRPLILEKGDHHLSGSRIQVEEITGKVVKIRRGNRSASIESKTGLLLNRLIGLVSLIAYTVGKVFTATEKRR
jgi:radical SAM protein with 4Fe4S-binding SPASM domain